MQETKAYNGWSNYETWLAYVWISNDDHGHKLLDVLRRNTSETDDKAEMLKLYYGVDLVISLDIDKVFEGAGLFKDLLSGAFERINWAEIVRSS